MTDDEVMGWLSEEERTTFRFDAPDPRRDRVIAENGWRVPEALFPTWQVMLPARAAEMARALAETRKALAATEFSGKERYETAWCINCDASEGTPHKPDCILATMPRPR